MKNLLRFCFSLFLGTIILFTACKKTDNGPADERKTDVEFQALSTYLTSNQMDLSAMLTNWIIPASTLVEGNSIPDGNFTNDNYYIIDIRSQESYDAGHIEGAVNSTLPGVLDASANAEDKTIVVVCYTGQTAAHAVIGLRLSGHPDAVVLKWGMSGWKSDFSASWTNNVAQLDDPNWVAAPGSVIDNKEYDDPDLQVTATDNPGILAERVTEMLKSFNKITKTDVLNSPGTFFINNFWEEGDVTKYGNITNAHRIKPLTISGDLFKYLDPSKTIVTYCWTGQTSSMVTAYLKVLGYDSKSLLFGVNGMIYDDLQEHKWSEPSTDLPVVPTTK